MPPAAANNSPPGGGWVPIPDPTKLTLELVTQAKGEIEKLADTKLNALRELIDQKFIGVSTEFTMRDIALASTLEATKAAAAQQQASNFLASEKTEDAFTKQMDNLNSKIDDLRERFSEVTRRNWAAVGGYIVGAIGVIGVVIALLTHTK